MPAAKPSIKSIAAHFNISITTVSFIINGKGEEKKISKELIKKVQDYIDEVGYVPHYTARSLRTGKTNVIGLIVEDISNQFFANVARHIEEYAEEKGYRILYCSSENDTKKSNDLIRMFRDRRVDGYIITPSPDTEQSINELLNEGSPVVLIDRYLPGVKTNTVTVDNEKGTYDSIKHLIAQGYKNIAFVTVESNQTQMQARLKGYKKAIDEAGYKQIVNQIPFLENSQSKAVQISQFLKSNKSIDAVFFATNYLGISGLEALKINRSNIGKDIAVISFDDHDLFRLYNPTITAVAQPIAEMTKQAMNTLLKQMNSNTLTAKKIVVRSDLIIRESSLKK